MWGAIVGGMSRDQSAKLKRTKDGELQRRILRVVRACDECTIRDVHEQLSAEGTIAYTTVQTVMTRLAEQGVLEREKRNNVGFFRASFSTDQEKASQLADDFVGRFGALAMSEFVERARANDDLFAQLKTLVARESDENPSPDA